MKRHSIFKKKKKGILSSMFSGNIPTHCHTVLRQGRMSPSVHVEYEYLPRYRNPARYFASDEVLLSKSIQIIIFQRQKYYNCSCCKWFCPDVQTSICYRFLCCIQGYRKAGARPSSQGKERTLCQRTETNNYHLYFLIGNSFVCQTVRGQRTYQCCYFCPSPLFQLTSGY